MPREIRRIAERHLSDPVTVESEHKTLTVPTVEQRYLHIAERQKLEALTRILDLEAPEAALIFVGTKLGDMQVPLLHGGHRECLVLALHGDRVAQMPVGDAPDLARHGGREEGRLVRAGDLSQDGFDVVDEPHPQHLVALVEHDGLEVGEAETAAAEMIEDPARRPHDHVHAVLQTPELLVHRLTAVDRQHAQARQMLAVGVGRLRDLDRELARRRQHQCLELRPADVESLQDGQREGGGLAGPRLRLADEIASGEERRDGAALNGGRRFVAELRERRQDGQAETELGEGRGSGHGFTLPPDVVVDDPPRPSVGSGHADLDPPSRS
jgi:hypothetical protein